MDPPRKIGTASHPSSPQWSITAVKSIDISTEIPSILGAMDTEDSPWGDVQSGSGTGSGANAAQAPEPEPSESQTLKSPTSNLAPTTPRTPASWGARTPRTPRRVDLQPTRLEALDDNLGPLGPLGDSAAPEPAPEPPSKERPLPTRRRAQPSAQPSGDAADSLENDGAQGVRPRFPPPVQPSPGFENAKRQGQPSVSIEQAAKPSFDITVGDPHKVGDLTSSHIVYQVRTRTTSKAYKQQDFAVSRRYRDFLWLYTCLHNNNPGVVIPPPPEKQAVGRFDTNFVESRRAALERMLNKTAAHPILQHDSDLKIFLESDAFGADVKQREHKELGLGESKGLLGSMGLGSGTSGGKFVEHDDWFHDRRIYLDALENQLRALLKSIDTVVSQRKGLADAAGDLSGALSSLAAVEIAPSLSGPLAGLSDLQVRVRELYERQAQQDVLTLGITVDEYIRLVASVKTAFGQRQKAYHSWHAAEAELQKRRATQDKVLRSGKTQQDRLNQLQADVQEGEKKCHQARLLFEDMGRLMRAELERFEREKVEDFKSGVETFLEGAVEAQKELIELWETFLMQLDADEEEDQPFFKPQPMQTEPLVPRTGPGGEGGAGETPAVDASVDTLPPPEDEPAGAAHAGDDDTLEGGEAHSEATTSTDI